MPTRSAVPQLRLASLGDALTPEAQALGERWCAAVLARDVRAIAEHLAEGLRTDMEVLWVKGRRGEWIDALSWAVLEETYTHHGRARSENVPSSGVIEAMVRGGFQSWTALARYPSRSWAIHPSFGVLEEACLDRLLTLDAEAPLMRAAREGQAVRGVVPSWTLSRPDLDRPTWLGRAAYHDRLDVVEHWIAQGAPVTQAGPCVETPWRIAWTKRFTDGSMNLQRACTEVPDLIEHHLRTTASDADWRREVLGMMDLLAGSRSNDSMAQTIGLRHPATSEALTGVLARALHQRPIELVLHEDEAAVLPQAPGVVQELLRQENLLLRRTFHAPNGIGDVLTAPLASRRRL